MQNVDLNWWNYLKKSPRVTVMASSPKQKTSMTQYRECSKLENKWATDSSLTNPGVLIILHTKLVGLANIGLASGFRMYPSIPEECQTSSCPWNTLMRGTKKSSVCHLGSGPSNPTELDQSYQGSSASYARGKNKIKIIYDCSIKGNAYLWAN